MAVGDVNTLLFIRTPAEEIHWSNLIQIWISCMCQDWICCVPRLFPLLSKYHSLVRKYCEGGMVCAVGLILPMRDSIFSILVFVDVRNSLMSFIQEI